MLTTSSVSKYERHPGKEQRQAVRSHQKIAFDAGEAKRFDPQRSPVVHHEVSVERKLDSGPLLQFRFLISCNFASRLVSLPS